MKNTEVKVIDVRTPMEFAGGHVEGSINIPLDTFGKKVNEILEIKEPIILCCASGMRSFSAYQFLTEKGCANVSDGGPWYTVADALSEVK